ncbi:hypothetical protein D7Y55_05775 [Stenotrophomonas maltophilia]|uniref:DNA methyltransferase n=1 Tax=Stenotrophomonas maltophilia group TaxID=995085 RepID=UPI0015DE4AF0|nr:hypothetical protein [Stenotrophomonas maltophilia]
MRWQTLSRADLVKGGPDSETRMGRCSALIGMGRPKSDKHHLTGKPTDLMRQLVQVCEQGERILDPFAGSGTALVAADAEGYSWADIKMMNHHYEVPRSRLLAAMRSLRKKPPWGGFSTM